MNASGIGPSSAGQPEDRSHPVTRGFLSRSLFRIGSVAAFTLGVLFLLAAVSLIFSVLQSGRINAWLAPIQNNWLSILFQFNANIGRTSANLLALNLLDAVILVLAGLLLLGLFAALRETSRVWAIVATIQPFLGLVLFLVTKMAGRSGVLGAVLVISIVMLRSRRFNKETAFVGILAGGCLLAGDMFTSFDAPSPLLASLLALGYVLLLGWFFLVGRILFQLAHGLAEGDGK